MKRKISLILSVVLLIGLFVYGPVTVSAEASSYVASDEMIELLKQMEGFDRYPRWDYQQWTVGYGSKCPDEDLYRLLRDGITEYEAELLLREELGTFEKMVNSFNDKYEMGFQQNQFDAILLFTYNMGQAWMFRDGTFRNVLVSGETGSDLMFAMGQWCHAGGEVLIPLVKRRLMEYNMYVNGEYSRTLPENYSYVIYEMNGGSGETDVQCFDSNLKEAPRVVPTKEGYTFAGWYTSNSGGVRVTVLDEYVRGTTLYARWTLGGEDIPDEPPVQEGAQPITPVLVTVTADHVNIRRGPGTNYSIVDRVSQGTQMTLTAIQSGSGYTWGLFEYGWIALMYTNYEEVKIPEPPVDPTEPPTEPTEPPTEPTEPPTEPTEPPTEPTEPPAEPTEPPTEPTEPPTEPTEPPTEPTEPPTEPTEPPTEPTEPPTEPTEPPTEPTEPPTEPTEPPTEPEPVMGTITGNDLCIRNGAGTGYAVIGFLHKGDRVEILEQKTVGSMNWGRISRGWISMNYVKLDPVRQEPEPPVDNPQEPAPKGTVTGDSLCIRAGAGTSYAVLGFYNKGDRVEILEQKTVGAMTWGRTEKGWISMTYVKLDEPVSQPPEEPVEPPTEPPVDNPTEPPVDPTEPEETVLTGTVTADCLYVREGAGTGYRIVGYLLQGQTVEILEQKTVNGMTWGRVSNGWVSMKYVELQQAENDPEDPEPVMMTVNADCLRVRSGAGTGYRVVGYLYMGAKVQVFETTVVDGITWARIENGWVSMEYLK